MQSGSPCATSDTTTVGDFAGDSSDSPDGHNWLLNVLADPIQVLPVLRRSGSLIGRAIVAAVEPQTYERAWAWFRVTCRAEGAAP